MPNSIEDKKQSTTFTILVIDDEINILQSIKRLLHNSTYKVLLAQSGEVGLAYLAKENIDLIISDMQMPGMSGAEFLGKVAIESPHSYRILLTGFSDLESTVFAINKGKVERYISKPWNNQELLNAIDEGLQKVSLKRENQRLQTLSLEQNKVLKELNHSLDHKIELRTQQIRTALNRIEQDHNDTLQVLFNFISINPHLDGNFGKSVCRLAKQLASRLELPTKDMRDLRLASLLCEIGLLGVHKDCIVKAFSELNYAQQQEFLGQTAIARKILSPASHLHSVIEIIASQFEYFNGSGFPQHLTEQHIPMGARILCVARDFLRYTQGRMTATKLSEKRAYVEIKKMSGLRYDPMIVELLLENKNTSSKGIVDMAISVPALEPGMQLKNNLYTDKHILILPENHLFTKTSIDSLQKLQHNQDSQLMLVIKD